MNKDTNSYKFFEDLIYDITEDYRLNENKNYDIERTIEKIYADDTLWQDITNAVLNNIVEKEKENDKN